MRFWNQLSLQTWVFLQAGLLIVPLFLALGYLSSDALNKSTSEALADRLLIAEQTAHRLDLVLDQSILQMEHRISAASLFKGSNAIADDLKQVYRELPLSPAYLAVVDGQGTLLSTEPHLPGIESALPPVLQDKLGQGIPAVTGPLPDLRGQGQMVYLITPIRDEEGSISGMALAAVDPTTSNLSHFLQPFSLGATGFAELVDRGGQVLATTQETGLLRKGDHADQFALLIDAGRTTSGTCHRCHEAAQGPGKEDETLAFAPLTKATWGVAIRQSEAEALAPARQLQGRFILLGLVSLGVMAILSWVTSRPVVKSVHQLQQQASLIAQGDLETPIAPTTGAEMIRLAHSLESMRQELQSSRQELEKWNRQLQQRAEAMTRQLESLVKASESLVATDEPEPLLGSVVSLAAEIFEADTALLFIWDRQSETLTIRAAVGHDFRMLRQVALQRGEGIPGKVFNDGQSFQSSNPDEIAKLQGDLPKEARASLCRASGGKEPQRLLCVPVESRDQILGSLLLATFQAEADFPFSSNVELAQTFTRIAAAILEHLRLLKEADRAQTLHQTDQMRIEFLSNVSHELQTPLASLRAALDMLHPTSSGEANDARAMLLENARRNAQRLHRLVGDLIDVARLDNLQMKLELDVLDLKQVVQQAIEKFEPVALRKGQILKYFTFKNSFFVLGDEHRLEQILGNLLMNAHQYSSEGGSIAVAVEEDGEGVIVSISDTGPGIAPEDKARLFERFYRGTSHQPASGLGLGLAIAKGLVELHGGKIWVEDLPTKGSRFCFSLPKASSRENTNC